MNTPYNYEQFANPQMKELCRRYTDHFVHIQTRDGHSYHAIIIDVDVDNITILVPEAFDDHSAMHRNDNDERFFGYGSYRPRFYRFRRLALPLAGLAGLSLLPFAYPYYPYYPVYPYY